MLLLIVIDNTLGIYFHAIVELVDAIQALGHDWEASAGNKPELN